MRIALKYGIGYGVAILLLAAIAVAAYVSATQYRESMLAVRRSQVLADELQAMRENLIDAETGERGYVITGLSAFLEPHDRATAEVPGRLAALETLTRDDLSQAERFAKLRDLVERRMQYTASVVADRRANGFDSAATTIEAGQGKSLMDGARQIVGQMIAMEKASIQRRQVETAESFRFLEQVSVVGTLATLNIMLIGGFLTMRNMNRRIDQLVEATRMLGSGNLNYRLETAGHDEVTTVGRAINTMADDLQEHKEALDSFVYTVSHDLRAPLRGMQGFSQAILEDYGDKLDETGRDLAGRVIAAAARMDELIQDLLDYSRLGRAQIEIRPIRLEQVVDSALSSLSKVIGNTHATVRVERPLPAVLGHRPILQKAVANLVSNAVKFVKPGAAPEIRVRAETKGPFVRLYVEDNGIGIDPLHHQRIFKVFERLHGIESYPGTGMGLAIVRKGMERLGGRAGVDSEPGRGSLFWIELPQGGQS